jgi:aryl-alcohol dehydrogenase-like predicted oxidoreductase
VEYRDFGRTGWRVSAISFGAWAIGGSWGTVDDETSLAALHAALDHGVNLIDTADVYGDGRSERLIAQLRQQRPDTPFYVATKAGRRLSPHTADGYTAANLTAFVERSLRNLDTAALDLLQLHCPPSAVYDRADVFGALDALVTAGKVRAYGVSVETIAEARSAISYPNVQSVQIIFNIFRPRPADVLFAEAARRNVAILARVPLASGLLTGKINAQTQFAADDHRNFNRDGAAFDVGETFAGVQDWARALQAVDELRAVLPQSMTMAQFALRWILMFPAVACAIPGAKTAAQAHQNSAAADLPPLTAAQMEAIQQIYDRHIRAQVHHLW